MANIICPGCGKEVEEGQTRCPFCGKELAEPVAQAPVFPAKPDKEPPALHGKTGKGLGWITFLRVILWLVFVAILGASLFFASIFINRGFFVIGAIGVLAGGIFLGFAVVAGGMIALNNATNLRTIATNTSKTVQLLEELKRK